MLSIHNLSKNYNRFHLLIEDLNFESGKMYGLIGENGAGKTTFFKSILGLESIDDGEVRFFEQKLTEKTRTNIFNKVGIAWDYSTLPQDLKTSEMAKVMKATYKNWDQEQYDKLMKSFGIKYSDKVKSLSRGNSNKFMLSLIISYSPKLLLLDEILANIDFITRKKVLNFLKTYALSGNSVILSSHNIDELEKYCDVIVLLKQGKILISDTVENIKTNYRYYELSKDEMNIIPKTKIILKKAKNDKTLLLVKNEIKDFPDKGRKIELEDIISFTSEGGLL